MQSAEYLLHAAFEATRLLETVIPEGLTELIAAIDPDASEKGAFILIQADDSSVSESLPDEIQVGGCSVQIICRPTTKLEVH